MSPFRIESPVFGMTGPGICDRLQPDYWYSEVGAIDAPVFLPRGSMRSKWLAPDSVDPHGRHYVSTTELRPGS